MRDGSTHCLMHKCSRHQISLHYGPLRLASLTCQDTTACGQPPLPESRPGCGMVWGGVVSAGVECHGCRCATAMVRVVGGVGGVGVGWECWDVGRVIVGYTCSGWRIFFSSSCRCVHFKSLFVHLPTHMYILEV